MIQGKFQKLCLMVSITCMLLLGAAYLLEYYYYFLPCSLCILQRFVFWAIVAIFLLGFLHNPKYWGQYVYVVSGLFCCLLGTLLALRQIYLYFLPAESMPSCTAGIEQLMKTLPFWDVLVSVITAPGDCAEQSYTVLGIRLGYWSLAGFVAVAIFCSEWLLNKKKVD